MTDSLEYFIAGGVLGASLMGILAGDHFNAKIITLVPYKAYLESIKEKAPDGDAWVPSIEKWYGMSGTHIDKKYLDEVREFVERAPVLGLFSLNAKRKALKKLAQA